MDCSQAAEEQDQSGDKDITPYWRTLKTGGVLNEKYPGEVEAQKLRLEEEGHTIIRWDNCSKPRKIVN